MAKLRYIDFECEKCGHQEERFLDLGSELYDTDAWSEIVRTTQICLQETICKAKDAPANVLCVYNTQDDTCIYFCGGKMRELDACARVKAIVRGNHDYNQRERERLEKRSNEHFIKKGKDEAVDRERMLMAKYKKQAGL